MYKPNCNNSRKCQFQFFGLNVINFVEYNFEIILYSNQSLAYLHLILCTKCFTCNSIEINDINATITINPTNHHLQYLSKHHCNHKPEYFNSSFGSIWQTYSLLYSILLHIRHRMKKKNRIENEVKTLSKTTQITSFQIQNVTYFRS